jgi:hypothetical protein
MDKNKIALASLAMDLKRVAVGIHQKSYRTADRVLIEARKRKIEIDRNNIQPYLQTIIDSIESLPKMDNDHKAEDALMYSTRIQNYILFK